MDESEFKLEDELYRGVKCEFFENGRPRYTAFYSSSTDGLSVDWSRFTTPNESWNRLNDSYKCLASITVDFVKNGIKKDFPQASLTVKHFPIEDNYSHCLIKGKITKGMAKSFTKNCVVVAP